jgi:hypothetical protein
MLTDIKYLKYIKRLYWSKKVKVGSAVFVTMRFVFLLLDGDNIGYDLPVCDRIRNVLKWYKLTTQYIFHKKCPKGVVTPSNPKENTFSVHRMRK